MGVHVGSDSARVEGAGEVIAEGCRDRVGGRRLCGFTFTCQMLGEGKLGCVAEGDVIFSSSVALRGASAVLGRPAGSLVAGHCKINYYMLISFVESRGCRIFWCCVSHGSGYLYFSECGRIVG